MSKYGRESCVHAVILRTLLREIVLEFNIIRIDLREGLPTPLSFAHHSHRWTEAHHPVRCKVKGPGTWSRQVSSIHPLQHLLQLFRSFLRLLASLSLVLNLIPQCGLPPLRLLPNAGPLAFNSVNDLLRFRLPLFHHPHKPPQTACLTGVGCFLLSKLPSEILHTCQSLSELMRLGSMCGLNGLQSGLRRRMGLGQGIEIGLQGNKLRMLGSPVL